MDTEHGTPSEVSAELVRALRSGQVDPLTVITALHDSGKLPHRGETARWHVEERGRFSSGSASRTRKISISMPEDLSSAVHERVGRGEFSRYVTEAVSRQLELDLLAELADLLENEYGPVSEQSLAEAEAAWPDAD